MKASVTLNILQLTVSLLLVVLVLLQSKGVGLSSFFGFGGGFYRSRRGLEKFVFFLTIFLALTFFVSSFLNLLIS